MYDAHVPTIIDSDSDDEIIPNKPSQSNRMASFIVKSKNDIKPKSKTICCNSMQEDEIPLELEFDNDDGPITHR